jgi:hypothetical protein
MAWLRLLKFELLTADVLQMELFRVENEQKRMVNPATIDYIEEINMSEHVIAGSRDVLVLTDNSRAVHCTHLSNAAIGLSSKHTELVIGHLRLRIRCVIGFCCLSWEYGTADTM